METPEMEFLLYLITCYVKNNSIDAANTTVEQLISSINLNLTPIGGG